LSTDLHLVQNMERTIRDAAGTAVSLAANRKQHPTYGVTKAQIVYAVAFMEGMIGLYMVLRGQAMHAGVPALAQFEDEATTERVESARNLTRQPFHQPERSQPC
jgi:hypothetical protein